MASSAAPYNSWARGQCFIPPSKNVNTVDGTTNNTNNNDIADDDDDATMSLLFHPTERCRAFDTMGYIHLPQFVSADVVASMKETMEQLVNDEWMMPSSSSSSSSSKPPPSASMSSSRSETTAAAVAASSATTTKESSSSSVTIVETFRTDHKQIDVQGRSDYFLDSADKIHFFAEPYAVTNDSSTLKEEYKSNKVTALNKAGHGLHLRPGVFREYATSRKIARLLRELGYVDPVAPQSMYIFKQGGAGNCGGDGDANDDGAGGVVTSHQDSTFLYTTPRQTCVGLWLALDDATINNGCLWVRPKSHEEGIRRQFVRNPRHFGNTLSLDSHHHHEEKNDQEKRNINNNNKNNDVGDGSICSGNDDDGDSEGKVKCAEPQMIFRDLTTTSDNTTEESTDTDETQRSNNIDNKAVPWEGRLPDNSLPIPDCPGLYEAGFIPLPCKAGDLLVFAGALDHLSLANYTSKARHTFQLHCVEGEGGGVTWSKENWLQYPRGVSFMKL